MAEQKAKVPIVIADVLADLENGIDRKAMQTKYGLSRADIGRLFKHPELKGKKVKKEVESGFVIVDANEATAAPTANATAEATVGVEQAPASTNDGW